MIPKKKLYHCIERGRWNNICGDWIYQRHLHGFHLHIVSCPESNWAEYYSRPREIGMCVYAVTITAMYILLLREGNFQVLVILKWQMDYVDFCFLPNKCSHGISSSCSKLLMNFQRKFHNLRAIIIILRARFWQKHYSQQNETCRE